MPDRARLTIGRSIILALCAALLTVPAVALGANPVAQPAADAVSPRSQVPGDAPGYRLPFPSDLDVPIHQGWNTGFSHNGKATYAYDFGLYEGTPVLAAARGVVSHVHDGETACGGEELRNFANYVTIDHPDGSATHYGHLLSVDVEVGDLVGPGQQIGLAGRTGYTNCFQHLHFARQVQGGPVTESIPVYFEGYTEHELPDGEVVRAPGTCAARTPTDDTAAEQGTDAVAPAVAASKADGNANASAPGLEPARASFCGSYYAGLFDGPAFFSRSESALRIDRTGAGPGGYWLDEAPDGYSARWRGTFSSATWKYTISVVALGGVRVTLDGLPLVDEWSDNRKPVHVNITQLLRSGSHVLEVEHYSTGGRDLLQVDWTPVPFED